MNSSASGSRTGIHRATLARPSFAQRLRRTHTKILPRVSAASTALDYLVHKGALSDGTNQKMERFLRINHLTKARSIDEAFMEKPLTNGERSSTGIYASPLGPNEPVSGGFFPDDPRWSQMTADDRKNSNFSFWRADRRSVQIGVDSGHFDAFGLEFFRRCQKMSVNVRFFYVFDEDSFIVSLRCMAWRR
jgi:hypothetical protein